MSDEDISELMDLLQHEASKAKQSTSKSSPRKSKVQMIVDFFEKRKERVKVLNLKREDAYKEQTSRQDKEKATKIQVSEFKQQKKPISKDLGNSQKSEYRRKRT